MNKEAYLKRLKSIRNRGGKVSKEFEKLVIVGIELYYTDSNHNIQVINDLINTASVIKGLRIRALVEYLKNVVPHKALGAKENYNFGKKDAELVEATKNWKQFIRQNPVWHEFEKEKVPADFNLESFITTLLRKIEVNIEKGNINKKEFTSIKEAVTRFDPEETFKKVDEKAKVAEEELHAAPIKM